MAEIVFRCPECGEEMEIAPRMAGKEIECVECGEWVRVPRKRKGDPGLDSNQWLLFTIAFLVVPAVNVIVSSILYYVWKKDYPKKANQINTLGFIIFGIHVLVYLLITFVIVPRLR